MKLGNFIKQYRETNNLTLRDFAKRTGLSYSYIGMLEKDYNYRSKKPLSPSLQVVRTIAGAVGLTLDELLEILDDDQLITINADPSWKVHPECNIPVLGCVKAGYDYLAEENIIGKIQVEGLNDINNCFALKVVGNSMEPVLYEGDIVVVHKQSNIDNSEIGIIMIEDEVTIKKIIKSKNYIELIAFNPYYPPKKYEKSDNHNIQIIGKVVEARIKKIFE